MGKIFKHGSESVQLLVRSIYEVEKIISHLEKFSLCTEKKADFQLWKEAYNLILNKQHLTIDGLQKIVEIKASMNRGLSDELKAAFPHVIPMIRPLVKNKTIENPEWLAGFVTAEGCFFVRVRKSKTKTGFRVELVFQITQHSRDEQLMRNLIEYLKCVNIYKRTGDTFNFMVTRFEDIVEKIIPLFQKYRIEGVKSKDFEDWCKVAELMKEKKHLTEEGLEQIKKIKAKMNKGRKLN